MGFPLGYRMTAFDDPGLTNLRAADISKHARLWKAFDGMEAMWAKVQSRPTFEEHSTAVSHVFSFPYSEHRSIHLNRFGN